MCVQFIFRYFFSMDGFTHGRTLLLQIAVNLLGIECAKIGYRQYYHCCTTAAAAIDVTVHSRFRVEYFYMFRLQRITKQKYKCQQIVVPEWMRKYFVRCSFYSYGYIDMHEYPMKNDNLNTMQY